MAESSPGWDAQYAGPPPPWDIGRPQSVLVELAEQGHLQGHVVDIGCGTGEHAILAAQHGATAVGVDLSARALELAAAKARERGVEVSFLLGDATNLEALGMTFDVAIDSGLSHGWDGERRAAYATSLGGVLRPGGVLFLTGIRDEEPGDWGPRLSERQIRTAFSAGWTIEEIRPCLREINRPEVNVSRAKAWLATVRRA